MTGTTAIKNGGALRRLTVSLMGLAIAALFIVALGACGDDPTPTPVPPTPTPAPEAPQEADSPTAEAPAEMPDPIPEGVKTGGTLTVTLVSENNTLDPPVTLGTADTLITQQIYDNLLMIQPDLSMKPELATSWEPNEELSSWTFQLREGVTFHNGKEFKAEDVVFSFERLLDPVLDSPARSTFEVIDHMEIIDDYTIRFDLVSASAFFPEVLSIYQARIVPSNVDLDTLTLGGTGTGPFILEEYLPGQRTVLNKNPDYWDEGKPYLDRVVFQLIPDPSTRAEALKSGDVDVIYQLEPPTAPGIEAHPGTVVLETASSSHIGLDLGNWEAPFDNKLVRQAFQAATDREAIRQAALFGRGSVAYDHPIAPNDPMFTDECKPPDYDPELAKQLLAQAGYPDGIEVTLYTGNVGPGMLEQSVAFAERAAPAGITVNLKKEPEDTFWADIWLIKNFTVVYWFGRTPDQALSIQYMSDSTWNAPRYLNDELDALIVKARGQVDEADRAETYKQIQCMLVEDVPRLVTAFQPVLYGVRDDVHNVNPHPLGWLILNEAWVDR